VEDPVQGWIVKATAEIKKNTFITEYSGTVIDFSDDLDSDSIMEFYSTQASNLVIYPDEYGNLGKYLSGINNQKVTQISKKKKTNVSKEKINLPNCTSQKFNINGGLHVVIYTIKDIKEGEILFYDYNAGHLDEIVTNDFV
jgi:SET domain-containing protein